jgi:RNA polymerase sigma-70 factor (ECF subfamily)
MNSNTGQLAESGSSTSPSLLRRLRDGQQEAWVRLTHIYGPLVYRWCRRSGVGADNIADIAQDVFHAVAVGIDAFRRQQAGDSFRGWLYGITQHKVKDHFRRAGRQPRAIGGTDAQLRLGQVACQTESSLDSATGGDDATLLLHRALEQIRGDFEEHTWQAFWRTTIDRQSATDVARELGMTANGVRQSKYRVLRRLRRELEELE